MSSKKLSKKAAIANLEKTHSNFVTTWLKLMSSHQILKKTLWEHAFSYDTDENNTDVSSAFRDFEEARKNHMQANSEINKARRDIIEMSRAVSKPLV